AGVLSGVFGIDSVDVLDETDSMGAEPGGEEDCSEIGTAAAQRDDAVFRMVSDEPWDDDYVMSVDLAPHGRRVEPDQIRIERRALGDQAHFMRVERPGPKSRLAQRQRHQRGRMKLANSRQPGNQCLRSCIAAAS